MDSRLARLRSEVLAWPGVKAQAHRFGGVEFRWAGAKSTMCMANRWSMSRCLAGSEMRSLL